MRFMRLTISRRFDTFPSRDRAKVGKLQGPGQAGASPPSFHERRTTSFPTSPVPNGPFEFHVCRT